ncbi:MAG: biopolymer transporter ExbD [candidate division WOR-3 bacterium]|nr:biopolymer transporter ExbD [candidate division WOR-3 bacterium]
MAVSLRKASGPQKVSIPTASQGDIAFLIMIFFMTTSMFAKEKGLKMVLPELGQATKIKAENILTVAVNPAGQVLVGDQIVNVSDVRDIVVKRLAVNSDLAIALRISRKAPYRLMVDVFDQLKLAKAERISLVPVIEEGTSGP